MARLIALPLHFCDSCPSFKFCNVAATFPPFHIPNECPLPVDDSKPSIHELFIDEFNALLDKYDAKVTSHDEYDSNDDVCGKRYSIEGQNNNLEIDLEIFT